MEEAIRAAAAASVLLVGSDYDGTLAPIVDDPELAHPDPMAIAALRHLVELPDTHVAIISGRARGVLARLMGPIPGAVLVGGHGAEWEDQEISPAATALAARLGEVAARYPGALMESKPTGAAFHYRNVDPALADGAAEAALAAGTELATRVVHGKLIVDFTTSRSDKGSALQRLRQEIAPDVIVFIGDDVTDEDAWAALEPSDVGIAIGRPDTNARLHLGSQTEVASLLADLVSHRIIAQQG